MKSLQKTIAGLAGLTLLAAGVAACGSSSGSSGNTSGTSTKDVSGPLAALAKKAEAEKGDVVWYESTADDQIQPLLKEFSEKFPGVKVRHVLIEGGTSVSGRVIQEKSANAASADLVTTDAAQASTLEQRGLLQNWNANELGISPDVAKKALQTPFALTVATTVFVLMYNTNEVKPADAPKSWDDILSGKWKGKFAHWTRIDEAALLSKPWGEAKAEKYVADVLAQDPKLYPSTYPVAQNVGSGTVPVGIGLMHTANTVIKDGAPLKLVIPQPTVTADVYNLLVKDSPDAAGAKLLAAWLATPEGNKAYENASGRGSQYISTTKTAEALNGQTTYSFGPKGGEKFEALVTKYNKQFTDGE